jgi:hypothetical protein
MTIERANQVIAELGQDACKEAWTLNRKSGEGCTAVAAYLGLKSASRANAAINAWDTLISQK